MTEIKTVLRVRQVEQMVNVRLSKKVQSLFCEAKKVFALQTKSRLSQTKKSAMKRAEKFDKYFARCLFFSFL